MLSKCMEEMASVMRPFLVETSDTKKVVGFEDLVRQYSFE